MAIGSAAPETPRAARQAAPPSRPYLGGATRARPAARLLSRGGQQVQSAYLAPLCTHLQTSARKHLQTSARKLTACVNPRGGGFSWLLLFFFKYRIRNSWPKRRRRSFLHRRSLLHRTAAVSDEPTHEDRPPRRLWLGRPPWSYTVKAACRAGMTGDNRALHVQDAAPPPPAPAPSRVRRWLE